MADQNGDPQTFDLHIPNPPSRPYSLATLGVHADDPINETTDVAPALHVSSTFRYADDPARLLSSDERKLRPHLPGGIVTGDAHVYSRLSAPNTSRLELLLTTLLGAPSLTYSSGLAAFHALLVYLHPRVVAIGAGYHGCHGVLKIYQKLTHCRIVPLDDPTAWETAGLGKGDVVHIETPLNPTGEACDIASFAAAAHARGAILTVDATFAPPPLLDPFKWGADFVMHSGTKYFGGHSDLLCGVIAVGKNREQWEADYWGMYAERVFLGGVMGSLEGWLGVRSLRTLELRVMRQSENCTALVAFLDRCVRGEGTAEDGISPEEQRAVKSAVAKIEHASLQKADMHWLKRQMPNGFGPVFALWLRDETTARTLPSRLELFHHATSLGGVESLIEWRRMSDNTVDPRVCRVSIGVENWVDLKADLVRAFKSLSDGQATSVPK